VKVLMTADAVGGVWTYALDLIRALDDVTFVLATMGPEPNDAQRAAAEALPNATLVTSTYALEWMDDPWDDVTRAGEWLLDLERKHAPDLVHLNGYAHGALPFAAPKIVVAHSCVLSWWDAVRDEPAPPRLDRYRAQVEQGLDGAQLVVAPTASMLASIDRYYRFSAPQRMIHNGSSFAPGVAATRAGVFAAGRLWDEAKNLSAVVEAAQRIAWPVRIADGTMGRDDMAAAYAGAGIFLHPALYEPFGLAVLEAARSGCALVLGDIPSLRELWGDAAVFVPPRDIDAIAATTNALIADAPRRAALAEAARLRAEEYGMGQMAGAYREVYEAETLAVVPVEMEARA
jgi:glycogen(starch) synthase